MAESNIEMGRRHVREGEARITRHLRLMDDLACRGHRVAWLQADRFLTQMEAFQRVAAAHLAVAIDQELARKR